jgi:hypothetical protein
MLLKFKKNLRFGLVALSVLCKIPFLGLGNFITYTLIPSSFEIASKKELKAIADSVVETAQTSRKG